MQAQEQIGNEEDGSERALGGARDRKAGPAAGFLRRSESTRKKRAHAGAAAKKNTGNHDLDGGRRMRSGNGNETIKHRSSRRAQAREPSTQWPGRAHDNAVGSSTVERRNIADREQVIGSERTLESARDRRKRRKGHVQAQWPKRAHDGTVGSSTVGRRIIGHESGAKARGGRRAQAGAATRNQCEKKKRAGAVAGIEHAAQEREPSAHECCVGKEKREKGAGTRGCNSAQIARGEMRQTSARARWPRGEDIRTTGPSGGSEKRERTRHEANKSARRVQSSAVAGRAQSVVWHGATNGCGGGCGGGASAIGQCSGAEASAYGRCGGGGGERARTLWRGQGGGERTDAVAEAGAGAEASARTLWWGRGRARTGAVAGAEASAHGRRGGGGGGSGSEHARAL
ncbi:hypothetical protein C8J57DRAFT_1630706 [Mycena rebaudengoi]|nr:hypothetical protein C8J57DRAFT_1630706 [Mycena rebaudengoi]